MVRVLKLEWLKLKHYRVFWVLFGTYLLLQLVITNGGILILEWLKNQGADMEGIDLTVIPIYDFPDIWQNSTWLGSRVKILIGFIVIISVNNDLIYSTLRQNIIDGISKKEFIFSKISIIILISATCTVVLFGSGLVAGLLNSSVTSTEYIFQELEFIVAYFVQLVSCSVLAFCFALVIKKTGFTIFTFTLYSIFIEPIITSIMEHAVFAKTYGAPFVKFFPVYSINNLIDVPFPKYLFREINDNVFWYEWIIVTLWTLIFGFFIYYRLNKKDIKSF